MRVIAGTAKGHKLVAPKGQRVRPALDKVKGAIFNILYDVSNARVLDLFAGSGAIGIEALSRGAEEAVFVEEWSEAVNSIQKNLRHCKFLNAGSVFQMTVERAIKFLSRKGKQFDLVFVDPPYLKNMVNPTLAMLAKSSLLHEGSVIVVEHHPKEPIEPVLSLTLTDSRKYGQTLISFLVCVRA